MTGTMASETVKLLPCPNPWCEHEANPATYQATSGRWRCGCEECGIEAPWAKTKADAIAAWNTRATLTRPVEAGVREGLAAELGHEIEGFFAEASSNPCICNVDERDCPHCNAWAKAIDLTIEALAAALALPAAPASEGEKACAACDLTSVCEEHDGGQHVG